MSEDDALAAELGLEPAPPTPAQLVRVMTKAVKAPDGSEAFPAKVELVDSRPPVRLTPAESTRYRDRTFTEVALFREDDKTYAYGRLSDRERKALAILLKTGSAQKAADEIGVKPDTIKAYMRRPFVKAYLAKMRERAAKAADLSMEKVAAVIGGAVDGDTKITDRQLAAATAAAKVLNPAGGKGGSTITVNQQNNFGSTGSSPFQNLDQSAMLDVLKQNLLEMQGPDE